MSSEPSIPASEIEEKDGNGMVEERKVELTEMPAKKEEEKEEKKEESKAEQDEDNKKEEEKEVKKKENKEKTFSSGPAGLVLGDRDSDEILSSDNDIFLKLANDDKQSGAREKCCNDCS